MTELRCLIGAESLIGNCFGAASRAAENGFFNGENCFVQNTLKKSVHGFVEIHRRLAGTLAPRQTDAIDRKRALAFRYPGHAHPLNDAPACDTEIRIAGNWKNFEATNRESRIKGESRFRSSSCLVRLAEK
jgi:hypothetical protein